MQILIELNELFYDILTRCDESYSDKFHKAIRKGTILPNEHGRLIDADELEKERIDYVLSGEAESVKDCSEFGMMLIKASTIIESNKKEDFEWAGEGD